MLFSLPMLLRLGRCGIDLDQLTPARGICQSANEKSACAVSDAGPGAISRRSRTAQ